MEGSGSCAGNESKPSCDPPRKPCAGEVPIGGGQKLGFTASIKARGTGKEPASDCSCDIEGTIEFQALTVAQAQQLNVNGGIMGAVQGGILTVALGRLGIRIPPTLGLVGGAAATFSTYYPQNGDRLSVSVSASYFMDRLENYRITERITRADGTTLSATFAIP
jgi:hypothetical protein